MTENIKNFFDNDLEDQELFAEDIPENPIMETEQVELPLENSEQTEPSQDASEQLELSQDDSERTRNSEETEQETGSEQTGTRDQHSSNLSIVGEPASLGSNTMQSIIDRNKRLENLLQEATMKISRTGSPLSGRVLPER